MIISLRRMAAGALLLSLASPVFAQTLESPQPFPDVPSAHANVDAIVYMKKHSIVQGFPDGTFGPEKGINRAEFTKVIIGAMFQKEEIEGCIAANPALFSDVPSSEWYAKYVCVAKEKGIIGGYSDGTFRGVQKINFVEANKILAGSFSLNTTAYDPANPDPIWYKTYVEATAAEKAIPTTIKTFESLILRGEIAEMVWRLKEKITNKPSLTYEDLAGQQSQPVPQLPQSSEPAKVTISCQDVHPGNIADETTMISFSTLVRRYDYAKNCIYPKLLAEHPDIVPAIKAGKEQWACDKIFLYFQDQSISHIPPEKIVSYHQVLEVEYFQHGCRGDMVNTLPARLQYYLNADHPGSPEYQKAYQDLRDEWQSGHPESMW